MDHKDLDAWRKSIEMVKQVYHLTKTFPKEELFGLTSQIRRSAVSVPSNIAEGAARNSNKDTVRFLYIALGSLAELETQLILSVELQITRGISPLFLQLQQVRKLVVGLVKYLERKGEQ